jgi:hypothetical protein
MAQAKITNHTLPALPCAVCRFKAGGEGLFTGSNMPKKAIHVRLDTELLAEIDKAADKMRPKESRTEYLERAAWQRIERERGGK